MGQLVFQATLGGQVNLVGPNTASTFNINVPAVAGNMVTTGDTGTVTNTMLAGSITNAKLTNSSVTIGSTSISLGATSTDLNGVNIGATTAGTGSFTTLMFNSGYGSVATAYGCRSWVNFNGTGTVAIRASGNVSSITDNGTGTYNVNFTTAMPNADFAVVGSSRDSGTSPTFTSTAATNSSYAFVNTQFPIGIDYDANQIHVSVFR